MQVFKGPYAMRQWIEACEAAPGGVVSPGGAAAMLRCSRRMIDKLYLADKIMGWAVLEGRRHTYIGLSVYDVVRYGIRVGRIERYGDIGLGAIISYEDFNRILEESREVSLFGPAMV